ncbi:MAG: hypothetical protein JWL86_2294 [Rhizobium sp.]|nr:hypothetical protein [Rhizobium sp.]
MKPDKKPFVVEIKNRRRLSRQEHSISGKIDLKAAGDLVAVEEKSGENAAATPMRQSEAVGEPSAAEINA